MIKDERQAETEVQQSDAAEVTTSSPTCCNTNVSRRKLSEEQAVDRLTMYEEAAQHLEMSVHETIGEEEQAKIVAAQIRSLAKQFEGRFYGG